MGLESKLTYQNDFTRLENSQKTMHINVGERLYLLMQINPEKRFELRYIQTASEIQEIENSQLHFNWDYGIGFNLSVAFVKTASFFMSIIAPQKYQLLLDFMEEPEKKLNPYKGNHNYEIDPSFPLFTQNQKNNEINSDLASQFKEVLIEEMHYITQNKIIPKCDSESKKRKLDELEKVQDEMITTEAKKVFGEERVENFMSRFSPDHEDRKRQIETQIRYDSIDHFKWHLVYAGLESHNNPELKELTILARDNMDRIERLQSFYEEELKHYKVEKPDMKAIYMPFIAKHFE